MWKGIMLPWRHMKARLLVRRPAECVKGIETVMEDDKILVKKTLAETEEGIGAVKKTSAETEDGIVIVKKTLAETEEGMVAVKKTSAETEDRTVVVKKILGETEDGEPAVKKILAETEDGKVVVKKTSEEMSVIVSGMLQKDGKSFVRVSFFRGKDWAEGIVPDGVVEKSEGFTGEEIGKLEEYLAGDRDRIMQQAKGVNPLRNMLGM